MNSARSPPSSLSWTPSTPTCRLWLENNVSRLSAAILVHRWPFVTFSDTQLQNALWTTIDDEIQLTDCDIYSYNPDLNSDPFGEPGSLWSFNYFFYNKKLKRIVFFNCRAIKWVTVERQRLVSCSCLGLFSKFSAVQTHNRDQAYRVVAIFHYAQVFESGRFSSSPFNFFVCAIKKSFARVPCHLPRRPTRTPTSKGESLRTFCLIIKQFTGEQFAQLSR